MPQKKEALQSTDSEIFDLIRAEEDRQERTIRLIPSENYASRAVLEATGEPYEESLETRRRVLGALPFIAVRK